MARTWNGIKLPTGVEIAEDNGRAPVVRLRITYKGKTGREFVLPLTKANIKLAADKMATVRLAMKTATPSAPFRYGDHFPDSPRCKELGEYSADGILLGAMLKDYEECQEFKNLEEITRAYYSNLLKLYIRPQWETVPVTLFTDNALEDWYSDLASGTAKTSVPGRVNKKIVLKSARNVVIPLRMAIERGWRRFKIKEINPFTLVKLSSVWPKGQRKSKYEKIPFDELERGLILKVAKGSLHNQFGFNCWSGLRPQEICALKWDCVDFAHGGVHVRRIMTKNGKILERTKTDAGLRFVPFVGPAESFIKAQKALTFMKPHGFVFENDMTGKPWADVKVLTNYQFPTLLRRAGVTYRNPQQCRHTFASMMIDNGEDIGMLSKLMGHETPEITLKHYVVFIKKRNAETDPTHGFKFKGNYTRKAA